MSKAAARHHRQRVIEWERAGQALEAAGLPFTVAVHVTWSACYAADQNPGNFLNRSEADRVNILWDRFRRLAAKHGAEYWIAGRAPECDRQKGLHLHMGLRLPERAHLYGIGTLERLTGAPHEFIETRGKTITHNGRKVHGVIARGQHGAWLFQRNTRLHQGGTMGFMRYVLKAPKADETTAQFRLSGDLLRIARANG